MHHPACGTAGDELHSKSDGPECGEKVFLFRDCTQLGEPRLDGFIWAPEMRRLEAHEHREVYLRLNPEIQLQDLDIGNKTNVPVFWSGFWNEISNASEFVLDTYGRVEATHTRWGIPEVLRKSGCSHGVPLDVPSSVLVNLATNVDQFPVSKATRHRLGGVNLSPHGYVRITKTLRDPFLREFSFVVNAIRAANAPAQYHSTQGGGCGVDWTPIERCTTCSVVPPKIWIRLCDKGTTKRESFEDPDDALQFERDFQRLPCPVTVVARPRGTHGLDLRLLLAPQVLPSKAFAHLAKAHATIPSGSLEVESEAKLYFSVSLDKAHPRLLQLNPLFDQIKPCLWGNDVGITSNSSLVTGDQPPRFTIQGASLRPDQVGAVNWMILRETQPQNFVEVEIDEEIVGPINMRVLGKAMFETRFPFSSRGGVVAHQIGYGKTIVVIALVDYQKTYDESVSISDRKAFDLIWREDFKSSGAYAEFSLGNLEPRRFFIHLKATLVIVPPHLLQQWENEITAFLGLPKSGKGSPILVIKTVAGFFNGHSREDLEKVEFIILSSNIFSDAFFDRLDYLSGMGDLSPKNLSGRHKDLWFKQVLRTFRMFVGVYLAGLDAGIGPEEMKKRVKQLIAEHTTRCEQERAWREARFTADSSRNMYKTGSFQPSTDGKEKPARPQKKSLLDDKDWDMVWLLACSFARTIWDECSYDEYKDNKNIPLFVANTVAHSKWLLSGTPKVFDLAEVCKTASVFGVHVARPEPRTMPGLDAVTKGPAVDQLSKSEEFYMHSSNVKSPFLAQERHEQAEKFVAQFYRANCLDSGSIASEEKVIAVSMPALAAVRYYLAHQEALDADMDFTALPQHARDEVALRGNELTDKEESAKLLLTLLACGLGRRLESGTDDIANFEEQRRGVLSRTGDQMKFLWDKLMWLSGWLPLFATPNSTSVDSTATNLRLVSQMTEDLQQAATTGVYDKFEGKEVFIQEVSCIVPLLESLRRDDPNFRISDLFSQDWVETFFVDKSKYTWTDFFATSDGQLKDLSDDQKRYLAQTLIPHQPATDCLSSTELLDLIQERGEQNSFTEVPQATTAIAVDGESKESLMNKARECNLKVTAATSVQALKNALLAHSKGVATSDAYWDGRAPSRRHDAFARVLSRKQATEELKQTLVHLIKTRQDFRATARELLFIPAYRALSGSREGPDEYIRDKHCQGCREQLTSAHNSFLVVACGHLLCHGCKSHRDTRLCPVRGCSSFVHERPVLRCSRISTLDDTQSKVGQVANLVREILARPGEERVLVFAQYHGLLQALDRALRAVDPRMVNLADMSKSTVSEALEGFKSGLRGRILLLDIDDDTSAGSNLTIANNVIFANPYSHNDPGHQARTIQQAKGRCIRYGQTKNVNVYHFMVSNTIEEQMVREHATQNGAIRHYFRWRQGSLPWWLDGGSEYPDHDMADVSSPGSMSPYSSENTTTDDEVDGAKPEEDLYNA